MDLSLFKYKTPIHLRWSDLDALNHVNNAKYLTYVEQARTQYLAEVYQWDWEKYAIILAHASVDFLISIEGHHKPEIMARVSRIGNKSFEMEYVILEGDIVFARSKCIMVCFDYQTGTTQAVPSEVKEKFIAFEGEHLK